MNHLEDFFIYCSPLFFDFDRLRMSHLIRIKDDMLDRFKIKKFIKIFSKNIKISSSDNLLKISIIIFSLKKGQSLGQFGPNFKETL